MTTPRSSGKFPSRLTNICFTIGLAEQTGLIMDIAVPRDENIQGKSSKQQFRFRNTNSNNIVIHNTYMMMIHAAATTS